MRFINEVKVLFVENKKSRKHIEWKVLRLPYYDELKLGIDFTARDVQQKLKEKGLPLGKGKHRVWWSWPCWALVPKTDFQRCEIILIFHFSKNTGRLVQNSIGLMLWENRWLYCLCKYIFHLQKGEIFLVFTGTQRVLVEVKLMITFLAA